jgi:LmbE family N-acetylglucosaminyl deacetylase
VNRDLPTPASALVIVAHPDDAEFQCGATLAKWAAAGAAVHHLICTDGSKGTWDIDCDQAALIATRQEEQRAAAAALGAIGEVVFLGWTDGELEADLSARSRVAYWIRRLRPDVVLGHDPWRRWRLHPDHRNAGFLAVDGVVAARDPFFFPEHEVPHHRPAALLLFESEEPDHVEDVTGHVDAKVAALLCHTSQFVTTHGIDDPADEGQRAEFGRRIADQTAEAAATAGVAEAGVRHAELYRAISEL